MGLRLLLDSTMDIQVVALLRKHGWCDCTHTRDHGLQRAADETIAQFAKDHGFLIISQDKTDFGKILKDRGWQYPSLVLLRAKVHLHPEHQAALLKSALQRHETNLEKGAIIVVDKNRTRCQPLP